ncbi:MAG TPA: hypothetical protein VJ792_00280 [Candidatus Nitrosotalea sp.]|nr:hypothetical protein [Candidatus Nitrosotalea sp.]
MFPKTLAIILAGCVGGVVAISVAMMAGAGWETPGTYAGTSNAAHAPTSTTHCYSFQTGCKNIQTTVPKSAMDSGAYLSENYGQ